MRRWPDVLPVPSIGYSLSPVDPSRRTDMEVGAPRVRAITQANNDLVDMAWVLTDPEFRAFRAWFLDEAWSIAGDSESLSGWALVGMTRAAGMALSPDLVSVDVLTEDTSGALHYAQASLTGAIAGGTVLVRATLKSDGRDVARLSFFDRAGVARYTNIDLSSGALGDTSGVVTRTTEDRGDGWWRVTLTADVGTGGSTPVMRVQSLSGGATNYTGDGVSTLSACEIGARMVTGADLHLRTDADGLALGAASGAAWAWMPVAVGNGLTYAECRFRTMFKAQAQAGLNWQVSAQVEVRNA